MRETYLGDSYSVNWMENADEVNEYAFFCILKISGCIYFEANHRKELLSEQFEVVKTLTNQSHVQQYGDISISNLIVGVFQGMHESINGAKQIALSFSVFVCYFLLKLL